jgi:hypothetical protein
VADRVEEINVDDYQPGPADVNELLARRLGEAREASAWLGSPTHLWLKQHLEKAQRRLIHTVAMPGMAPDERLLLLGKLSLINDLLAAPANLAELLARHTEAAKPIERPPRAASAPSLL